MDGVHPGISRQAKRHLQGLGVDGQPVSAAEAGCRPMDRRTAISRPRRRLWRDSASLASAGITACASAMIARSARLTMSAWRSVLTATTRSQRDDALEMLRRTGDSEGEITARLDQAAGGADLTFARQEPGIADDAAAAFGGTKRRGHCMESSPSR